ncbi:hypothetical protein ACFVMC_21375 [Nocardia sp. NPDC127579]|uniref:hypothetical protein n=1 Tax=Nocardia sp. NPDC127579 TaxID=3345402 RepID=UPI003630FCA1
MNLDFSADPEFSWYVVLLFGSGLAMLAMSFEEAQGKFAQILNTVFGVLYVGYAGYLAFVFESGSYLIFFQAFILPVLLAYQWWKSRRRTT